jgi:DNA-binding MarR family transcriptional regulator
LTGETQLRARLTRIKILRAIAERNGSAGFSEIKNATGLSTGSIYYHLERMGNYVTKDSKHYKITEEGLELLREILREIDNRSTVTSVHDKEEETSTSLAIQTEETIRQPRPLSELVRDYSTSLLIVVFLVFVSLGLYVNLQVILQALITAIFIGNKIITHTSLISSFLISVLLLMSFLIMLKKQLMPAGHSKMMVSL